jgi:hypothetical protein
MSGEPQVAEPTVAWGGPAARENLVDREARNPFFRYLMHLGLPLSVSLVIHVGVLAFLALKTFDVLTKPRIEVGEWEGTVVEAGELGSAFQWSDQNVLEAPADTPLGDALDSLTNLPAVSDFGLSDLNAREVGTGIGDGTGLGLGDGPLSLLGTGSGAGEAGTGGFGSGLGGGGARIGQAGIWNLTIRANKIVYVVDFSGSIIVAVDDLKRELKRSVGRLAPSQSFDVIIFYSSGGGQDEKVRTESFKPKLQPADRETRLEFFQWIDRKAPMGVTEPLQAVKRALSLNPEVIFFFSDGWFDDSVVSEIERANRSARARIYCLVFDELLLQDTTGLPRETEGARRLKRIAEANRGQVKIVTGKDLTR